MLEEIRKEKLSHGLDFANAKSGKRKSKKETALAGSNSCGISEEEIPFEIPENWCWCRLGEICTFENGDRSSNYPVEIDYTSDGIPFFGAADMKNNKLLFSDNLRFISEEKFDSLRSGKLQNKDYVMLLRGAVGKWAQFLNHGKYSTGFINAQMVIIRAYESIVEYIKVLFNSPIFEIFLRSKTTGTAVAQMSAKDLSTLLIPLPPLAEQKRIVAAIEKFMPLIEEYGKKESALKAINEQIGALTKKAILQEAVQGKLVPQIASEGNARDLLEEIRKEKLSHGFANSYGICDGKNKKTKSSDLRSKSQIRVIKKELPEITEDEIPFDIPESWCWCRLGEIGDWKAGSTPSRSNPELYNGNIPWLKTGDLTDGDINEIPECISEKALESCSMRLNPIGSVLIAMYGATIGKLGILKIEATTNQACCACVPYNGIYNKYLFYYLMSQKKDFTEKAEGGAQPNISREKLVVHLLPLPPYEEQKRIVAAIEKMLPLCEKLGE
ncbi:MAG: restriction endonuclease subunit S [Treponema sp.]|nr:restriction endonuclease subunit S [Treponema sp.]